MTDAQVKAAPPPGKARKILVRVFWVVVIALAIGAFENGLMALTKRAPGPAGFGRGLVHGALMPAAMPNLMAGRDVTIYAESNTGRTYKLGYTMGVNGCGAIFFGIFFWRLNKWRKRARARA
jgi:hypothetical protein